MKSSTVYPDPPPCGGDLVKLDVTLEQDGYIADAARSVDRRTGSDVARSRRLRARRVRRGAHGRQSGKDRSTRSAAPVEPRCGARGLTVVRGLTGHGVGRTIHEPPTVPNQVRPAGSATCSPRGWS